MRKRVGLARALVMEPELILCDEPTQGLDPVIGALIDELIIDLTERTKTTSIIVTHLMDSAFHVATRMAMLHRGKITEQGTTEHMRQSKNPNRAGEVTLGKWQTGARNQNAAHRSIASASPGLLDFHFDRFWLRHRAFWQMNLQHAVMKLSHDLGWIRILGHCEPALKRAEGALKPMKFSLLFFLLGFALAGNVKNTVFDCYLNVILLHFGQVSLEQILVIIFGDVHQGRPIG
jgi:hypothetical protein